MTKKSQGVELLPYFYATTYIYFFTDNHYQNTENLFYYITFPKVQIPTKIWLANSEKVKNSNFEEQIILQICE